MNLKQILEGGKAFGVRSGYMLVKVIRRIFRLMAWVPLGIVLYPFRRFWVVKQVPNLLSGARLVLTPPIAILYFFIPLWQGHHHAVWRGLLMMAGLALLDAIDGPLADILEATSDVGKLLDPAADKMLVFTMLVGYVVLAWHEVGWMLALPIAGVAIWVLSVEYKLIRIANDTKNRVLALRDEGKNPQLQGANIFGKVKFNLQMLAIFSAWYAMIEYPNSPWGPVWMITILMIARFFADKSLGQHRKDLAEL